MYSAKYEASIVLKTKSKSAIRINQLAAFFLYQNQTVK